MVKVVVIGAASAALLGGAYFAFANGDLPLCDEAIMRTLKAPSTYKRVSSSRNNVSYSIEYDAGNSFGVPVRQSGSCIVEGGSAVWYGAPRFDR